MLQNTKETYGLVAQLLHWATALLILILIPLGVYMHELPIDSTEQVAYKSWFYSLHKTLGVTVFGLAIIRVIWAVVQPKPRMLHPDRKVESFLASTIHWTLYGSIIAMPLTGWLHHSALEGFAPIWWPFGQDLPFVPKNSELADVFGAAHFFTAILLVLSLVLHIAGAFKHAFIDQDMTLKRMVPGKKVAIDASELGQSPGIRPAIVACVCFLIVGISVFASNQSFDGVQTNKNGDVIEPITSQETAVENSDIAQWIIDSDRSSLGISITQNGKPVQGRFDRWQADIVFDPEQLDKSRIRVLVDIASLNLGAVSQKALDKPLLNVKAYPEAEFISDRIVDLKAGKYEANGQLTLVGVTKPFVLPFTLSIENDQAKATAGATIKRLDFGIGAEGFQTDGSIGFDVSVSVELEANKQE